MMMVTTMIIMMTKLMVTMTMTMMMMMAMMMMMMVGAVCRTIGPDNGSIFDRNSTLGRTEESGARQRGQKQKNMANIYVLFFQGLDSF